MHPKYRTHGLNGLNTPEQFSVITWGTLGQGRLTFKHRVCDVDQTVLTDRCSSKIINKNKKENTNYIKTGLSIYHDSCILRLSVAFSISNKNIYHFKTLHCDSKERCPP